MPDIKGYTKKEQKLARLYWDSKLRFEKPSDKPIVVILQCSATKLSDPEGMAAYLRYDGPMWKTFRKICMYGNVEEKVPFRFLVLSAEFGLIPVWKYIPDYDTKLGRDVSKSDLTKIVSKQLKKLKIEGKDIYAFTSRDYSAVLAQAGLSFDYVKGGIGEKRNRLKQLWGKQKLPKRILETYKKEL